MLHTALFFLFAALQDSNETVTSHVRDVTVYPGSALVTRVAELPGKNGKFVIGGLPWSLDPTNLRIRANGADLIGMETRERHTAAAVNPRVEALRGELRSLERELAGLQDERATLDQITKHLERLLSIDENDHNLQVRSGQASADAWRANLQFLTQQLGETRGALRENQWKSEDLNTRIEDLRRNIGACNATGAVDSREVVLDLIGRGDGGAKIEIDYVVGNAGWQPNYDLRAARDAKSVELDYRAQVWQASGEDWSDVELSLSTAQPRRGAQGPDPEPIWLRLYDPRAMRAQGALEDARQNTQAKELDEKLGRLVTVAKDMPASAAPTSFAQVDSQGLSARFHLARRESIQSRTQPTQVLIGEQTLEATPEYFCTPSIDASVWLRGRTKNATPWILLPGEASVYFGADFVGRAALAAVQPGEEFTLHLGVDEALACERIQRANLHEGAGVFSSKAAHTESWTVRLKNHGAAAAQIDGSALVYVREALPRSTDERLKIELSECKPEPVKAERWKKDRDEKGIATWALRVPKNGEATLDYTLELSFPERMQVSP